MVGVLNSSLHNTCSSPSQYHYVAFLGKTNAVLLSSQLYKWVPADLLLRVTPQWQASHPGGIEVLLVASCSRNQEELRCLWDNLHGFY